MTNEKRYTLIKLDAGSSNDEGEAVESENALEQEETIVVSAAGARRSGALPAQEEDVVRIDSSSLADGEAKEARAADPAEEQPEAFSADGRSGEADGDSEGVPFQRMQTIIIICLIVVIVAFLVYFNFLR